MRPNRLTILTLTALLLAAPARAAKPSLQAVVAAAERQAAKLAAAGKVDQAFTAIASARDQLKAAMQRLPHGEAAVDPRKKKELAELDRWTNGQAKLAREGKVKIGDVYRRYKLKRKAIDARYDGPSARKASTESRRRAALTRARYHLLEARLADVTSTCLTRARKPEQAAAFRRTALKRRIDAYRTLGQPNLAVGAATKALAAAGTDPETYSAVGVFFQESKDFGRAANVWERGIALLESGKTERSLPGTAAEKKHRRTQQTEQFYRQLVFCYQKLGKTDEMKRALERANQLAAAARAG